MKKRLGFLIVLVLVFTAKASVADIFAPRLDYGTAQYPFSMTTGDFNGDGKVDLATANDDATISILLGNGDGTFQQHKDFICGRMCKSVATGDFNNDGKADLVASSGDFIALYVFLGNGDGTFQLSSANSTDGYPWSVTVDDFNGDGKADLATTSYYWTNTVSILLGNGDGTFQPYVPYRTGGTPFFVVSADFNADGKVDLVTANRWWGNSVSVLMGNGDGTFMPGVDYATGLDTASVTIGDFNLDEKLDIAAANFEDSTVAILLGNGDGTFQPKTDFATGSGPVSIYSADFNRDRVADIVTANYWDSAISVFIGKGDGTFYPRVDYAPKSGPTSLIGGDFNIDGWKDVATTNFYSNTVSIFLNILGDIIAPVTTMSGGDNDWHNKNVVLNFYAFDDFAGVKEIHYIENGIETVVAGNFASLTVSSDGIHNITYFAVDYAGNVELPKNMTVKIDKTPPILNITASPNILWPPDRNMIDVFIGGGTSDLSGVEYVTFTLIDEYGVLQPVISGFNETISLEAWREGTDKDGRTYTITAVATDAAGNKAMASTVVLVPHDQR